MSYTLVLPFVTLSLCFPLYLYLSLSTTLALIEKRTLLLINKVRNEKSSEKNNSDWFQTEIAHTIFMTEIDLGSCFPPRIYNNIHCAHTPTECTVSSNINIITAIVVMRIEKSCTN